MRGQTEKEYLLVSKTFMCPPFFTRNAFLPVIFVLSKDGHQNFSICFTAKSVPVKWTRTHMYAKFYSSQNNILDLAFGKYFEGITLGYFKGFFWCLQVSRIHISCPRNCSPYQKDTLFFSAGPVTDRSIENRKTSPFNGDNPFTPFGVLSTERRFCS